MSRTRQELLRWEIPFGALGAALVVCAFTFAAVGIPRWIPPALLVRVGVPSPLSGMTRAFVAFAQGDVAAAFAWHPLGPIVFALCSALPIVAIVSWVCDRHFAFFGRVVRARATWVVVCSALVVAWARQIAVLG